MANEDQDFMLNAIHMELQRTNSFLHLIARELARAFEGARQEYQEFQKDLPRD